MASVNLCVPLQVVLPENWMDQIIEKIKLDDQFALVVKCKNCILRRTPDCPAYFEEEFTCDGDTERIIHDNTIDDGFCDRGDNGPLEITERGNAS